jgi:hypothetical protein
MCKEAVGYTSPIQICDSENHQTSLDLTRYIEIIFNRIRCVIIRN